MSIPTEIKYLNSTKPSIAKNRFYKVFYKIFGPLLRYRYRKRFSDIRVYGKENLKGGPYLVLMNHSCPIDPDLITFFGKQPLHFLITEPCMRENRFEAKLAAAFGQIKKRKLDFDISSIQLMKEWIKCGANVAMFPEGGFSWSGKKLPLMSGLKELILHLDIPVVTVHLANGHKVKPAWAEEYRKTEIEIHIHPPKKFSKDDNIIEYINEKIFNLNHNQLCFESSGYNLAKGLAKQLRFCPKCGKDNSLRDKFNNLICSSCNESWEIDSNNQIVTHNLHVEDLFNATYKKSFDALNRNGKIYSNSKVKVYDGTKQTWKLVNHDILIISKDVLNVGNFSIKVQDINNLTLDWDNYILVKTMRKRIFMKLDEDSRAVFFHLIKTLSTKGP